MKPNLEKVKSFVFENLFPISIFFIFLIVYSLTMVKGLGGRINFGDSIKWQYLYKANGLPHGSGYPQMLLLTEIFSKVFVMFPEHQRITFISVFFGALTLVVFYLLVDMVLANRWKSALATGFYGLTVTFWTLSTEPEVYTLNTFYLLTVLYLFLKYAHTRENSYFLIGCAVYAISFGNHLSMVTILPAILYITVTTDYKSAFTIKNISIVASFIVIGLLQYVWLYYKAQSDHLNAAITELPLKPTISEFITYATGSYATIGENGFVKNYGITEIFTNKVPQLFAFLNQNFNPFGLILVFAGFFYTLFVKKQKTFLAFLTLSLFGELLFSINYNVGDLVVFFLPVYIILGIFAGLSLAVDSVSMPIVFTVVFYLNVFYNNTRNVVKSEPLWNYLIFHPIQSLYDKEDYPLYAQGGYYHATYNNYMRVHGQFKNHRMILHDRPLTAPYTSFYVLKDMLVQFADTNFFRVTKVKSVSLTDYVKSNVDSGRAVFFSVLDEASSKMPADFKVYCREKGGTIENLGWRGSYVGVVYNNKMCDRVNNSGPIELSNENIPDCDPLRKEVIYSLFSAGLDHGNTSKLKIDGIDYNGGLSGLNIVVYDLKNRKPLEFLNFNTFVGEEKELYLITKK